MLSMPRGTDPLAVQRAAREFVKTELADHKYVMVLHDHQANPHVHISVRAESKHNKRLNPRKADLHRWRETFAEKLRELGIDAEATRQASRVVARNPEQLWPLKAREDGRLHKPRPAFKQAGAAGASRGDALSACREIATALATSGQPGDERLAQSIAGFAGDMQRQQASVPERGASSAGQLPASMALTVAPTPRELVAEGSNHPAAASAASAACQAASLSASHLVAACTRSGTAMAAVGCNALGSLIA
jgi:hypothetical protein